MLRDVVELIVGAVIALPLFMLLVVLIAFVVENVQ